MRLHRLFFGLGSQARSVEVNSSGIGAAGMRKVFPQLGGTAVVYTWSGRVAFTTDQMPHAGTREGVHFAIGYCGHGVAMAPLLGARLGATLAGRGDLYPFADLPFRAVPLYDGRPWFLPLVGAWYRMVDRLA